MPLILAFRRERQEDQEFKARLTYKANLSLILTTRVLFLKTQNITQAVVAHTQNSGGKARETETLSHKTNQRNKNPTKML